MTTELPTDEPIIPAPWHEDIVDMHVKFGVHQKMVGLTRQQLLDFLRFRTRFLEEELTELRSAVTPEAVVDALIDLCVVAIGTMDLFGILPQVAWEEVHRANMAKATGVNPNRPNPFGFPDLIKPDGWEGPNHAGNIGLLAVALQADETK